MVVEFGPVEGGNEALVRLAEHLKKEFMNMTSGRDTTTFSKPSDREIAMSRVFDAPRELVFQAYTDPVHIPHWWGQRSSTTIIDTFDVRPGGAWRFIERDPEGNEYAFRGEFR